MRGLLRALRVRAGFPAFPGGAKPGAGGSARSAETDLRADPPRPRPASGMSVWPVAGLALALALAGYAAGWLSPDGVIAAALVGTAVLAGNGLRGGAPLALFFVSGSVLTAANHRAGFKRTESKGPRRDARQVLANGLWAAVGAGLVPWNADAGWAL